MRIKWKRIFVLLAIVGLVILLVKILPLIPEKINQPFDHIIYLGKFCDIYRWELYLVTAVFAVAYLVILIKLFNDNNS